MKHEIQTPYGTMRVQGYINDGAEVLTVEGFFTFKQAAPEGETPTPVGAMIRGDVRAGKLGWTPNLNYADMYLQLFGCRDDEHTEHMAQSVYFLLDEVLPGFLDTQPKTFFVDAQRARLQARLEEVRQAASEQCEIIKRLFADKRQIQRELDALEPVSDFAQGGIEGAV